MNVRIAGATRRWWLSIAIVTALSVFVALIAGSSLRPQFAASAPPEPAAWTHTTPHVQSHADQLEFHAAAHAFSPASAPTNKKPFHSMWMTRDRPVQVTHLSLQSGWFALPVSFGVSELQPDRLRWAAFAKAPDDRDALTLFCVARC